MFDSHRERLVEALDAAHAAYYQAAVFGGPSLYFHRKALDAGKEGDFDRFVDSVYALLAAWGMHRMGRGGSKMREFDEFQASLKPVWPLVLRLQQVPPENLGETDWRELRKIFTAIRCMASGTSLVGNSKVMAHAIPNLVPPIDREYTLKFLFGRGNITNDIDAEWAKLQTILRHFFHPMLQSEVFKSKSHDWMERLDEFKWDTSPLKIVDNLVIGFSKHTLGENAPSRRQTTVEVFGDGRVPEH
jgi:hypothetical protein